MVGAPAETVGNAEQDTLPTLGTVQLTASAFRAVRDTPNPEVRKQAEHVLSLVLLIVSLLERTDFDVSGLRPIKAYRNEDGSLLLEWLFPSLRIGFGIEVDPTESGWYLVGRKALKEFEVAGKLSGPEDLARIILAVLSNV